MQIISLGSHSIDADFEQAVLLMEIMPTLLAKRSFDPLNTLTQLEPGYRDSPDPHQDMAIVFVKVLRPYMTLHTEMIDKSMISKYSKKNHYSWENKSSVCLRIGHMSQEELKLRIKNLCVFTLCPLPAF